MKRRSYSLYPRRLKKGTVYYVRFRASDGSWGKTISTGQTNRSRAETWTQNYLAENELPVDGDKVTLGKYVVGFFDEDGPYARRQRSLNKRLSVSQLLAKQASVKNHILPAIGGDTPLSEIDEDEIDNLRAYLREIGKAPSTVNHTLSTMKAILDQAKRERLISHKPDIERLGSEGVQERDTFTVEEAYQLFHLEWEDERALLANLLASVTGMRAGEIQGLKPYSIFENGDEPYIHITESWNPYLRTQNETTKTGKSRKVPIDPYVYRELQRLIAKNPYRDSVKDPYIFYADKGDGHPIEQKVIRNGLYHSLRVIGISSDERKARRLVFHSWRHFANSYFLNNGANPSQVRFMIGHETQEMQEHYTRQDELAQIRAMQGELIKKFVPGT